MAMGEQTDPSWNLSDIELPPQVTAQPDALVKEAFEHRPELAAARLNQSAAQRFAEAEKKLMYPTVSALAVAGVTPFRTTNLTNHYSAAGVNITVPFLNGGLFSSRHTEAEFRAQAADRDTEALAVQVAAAVRTAGSMPTTPGDASASPHGSSIKPPPPFASRSRAMSSA